MGVTDHLQDSRVREKSNVSQTIPVRVFFFFYGLNDRKPHPYNRSRAISAGRLEGDV